MLVLARRTDEEIVVVLPDGRILTLKVVAIRDNKKVRIGFDAPADVVVHRREVYDAAVKTGTVRERLKGKAVGDA